MTYICETCHGNHYITMAAGASSEYTMPCPMCVDDDDAVSEFEERAWSETERRHAWPFRKFKGDF